MAGHRKSFGSLRKLPSGRYQARYTGPDLDRHAAPLTFQTKSDAEGWLATQHASVLKGEWSPPSSRADRGLTFGEYAEGWLDRRDLKPRTRSHYRRLLDTLILTTFEGRPIRSITPTEVADWHARLTPGRPTMRAHSYALARSIFATAVTEDVLSANPCRVRGGGSSKRQVKIRPASLDELRTITAAMPPRLRLAVILSSWCGLRFGEMAELRRGDLDLKAEVIRVRRGVTFVKGESVVGTPKSAAGVRDVSIPPHLLPMVRDHLAEHVERGRDALLFPAADGVDHLRPSTLYGAWYPARKAAGRDDLRWHDLRHTGAVLAASTGATLAELMARLGHSTPGAALRYQHASQGRDAIIAAKLSELAAAGSR